MGTQGPADLGARRQRPGEGGLGTLEPSAELCPQNRCGHSGEQGLPLGGRFGIETSSPHGPVLLALPLCGQEPLCRGAARPSRPDKEPRSGAPGRAGIASRTRERR